jgi:glycosyltransferase involved in cell wall biosynthesis
MDNPLVSIIIPAYNASAYLREAVDSALAQSYPHTEILIVNDGSDDSGATESAAAEYGSAVRYFRKENGGVSSALNFGVSRMRGQWFSWLSHDDRYEPGKIERQIEALRMSLPDGALLEDPKAVVFSDARLIDAAGRLLPRQQRSLNRPGDAARDIVLKNLRRNNLMGCTFLVPRAGFTHLGGFDESLRALQDYDYWYRLLFAGYRFIYVDEPLVSFRVHRDQVTYRIPERIQEESSAFYLKTVERIGSHPELGTFSNLFTLGCYLLERGNEPEAAREAFRLAAGAHARLRFLLGSLTLRPAAAVIGKLRLLLKKIYFRTIIQKRRT